MFSGSISGSFASGIHTSTPVSYTHLDVYKRQVQVIGKKIVLYKEQFFCRSPEPVSYTHLDVYKRQG